jgi:hypothetical protein
MATLPENVGFNTEIDYVSQPSKTWMINRQTMRVQGNTDNLPSVRQAAEIILSTTRYAWQVYTANLGTELESLIGEDSSYIESELPRMVEDALLIDDRIIEVGNFQHTTYGDTMTWTFTVVTVYGAFSEELTI